MKYRYKGEYAEFRGYVFAYGRPVDVTDSATLKALAERPDYEPAEGGDPVSPPPTKLRPTLSLRARK